MSGVGHTGEPEDSLLQEMDKWLSVFSAFGLGDLRHEKHY